MPKQAKPKTSDQLESGLRSSRGITSALTFVSRLHPSAPIVRLPDGEISDDLFGNWLGIAPESRPAGATAGRSQRLLSAMKGNIYSTAFRIPRPSRVSKIHTVSETEARIAHSVPI